MRGTLLKIITREKGQRDKNRSPNGKFLYDCVHSVGCLCNFNADLCQIIRMRAVKGFPEMFQGLREREHVILDVT